MADNVIDLIKARIVQESDKARADMTDSRGAIDRNYRHLITYGAAYLKNRMLFEELEIMNVGIADKTMENISAYFQTFQAGLARRLTFETGLLTELFSEAVCETVRRIGVIISEFQNLIVQSNEKGEIRQTETVPAEQKPPDR